MINDKSTLSDCKKLIGETFEHKGKEAKPKFGIVTHVEEIELNNKKSFRFSLQFGDKSRIVDLDELNGVYKQIKKQIV